MSHKKYFSYIRVSTQRQGQTGTSLTEQQAAIERFAQSWNLPIVKRFEERETAAKQGRPVFLEMLKQLKGGKANGVIIHKIDRSARNLKDWADLGSLIDGGLEVHFAAESLDLNSRGGRLSADIQAVVASDYIRNLREETKKGLYGRLKQGLYPFRAVIGYLDTGKGRPKEIDPIRAPLIRTAFELYATGNWGLHKLSARLLQLGLTNRNDKKVTVNGLSTILRNPFYMGVIRIEKTNETFSGVHSPLISKSLFDQVQEVLDGKNIKKENRHFFAYRRMIRCGFCKNYLIPERKKKYVYYRCHTSECTRTCLKEETITREYLRILKKLELTIGEYNFLRREAGREAEMINSRIDADRGQMLLQFEQMKTRQSRLVDALMDGVLDKDAYLQRKGQLVFDEQALKEKLTLVEEGGSYFSKNFEEFLELANSAYLSYKSANDFDRRDLVKNLTLEFFAEGKSSTIKLKSPFDIIASRPSVTAGSPNRETTRNFLKLFKKLCEHFKSLSNNEIPENNSTTKRPGEYANTLPATY
jgi:site-specific DNA recombinase